MKKQFIIPFLLLLVMIASNTDLQPIATAHAGDGGVKDADCNCGPADDGDPNVGYRTVNPLIYPAGPDAGDGGGLPLGPRRPNLDPLTNPGRDVLVNPGNITIIPTDIRSMLDSFVERESNDNNDSRRYFEGLSIGK
ncbi:MAG: hypothetical protein EP326_07975 [Deltaproteobacteria bacterium]|nr:MAG: hypothetical protein EP326_07975 [Deltaproteobacteria bacterium]TNF26131.1 MAG: hypothetical protein EP319_14610 [Deltaproteobacteria bacterium]